MVFRVVREVRCSTHAFADGLVGLKGLSLMGMAVARWASIRSRAGGSWYRSPWKDAGDRTWQEQRVNATQVCPRACILYLQSGRGVLGAAALGGMKGDAVCARIMPYKWGCRPGGRYPLRSFPGNTSGKGAPRCVLYRHGYTTTRMPYRCTRKRPSPALVPPVHRFSRRCPVRQAPLRWRTARSGAVDLTANRPRPRH